MRGMLFCNFASCEPLIVNGPNANSPNGIGLNGFEPSGDKSSSGPSYSRKALYTEILMQFFDFLMHIV